MRIWRKALIVVIAAMVVIIASCSTTPENTQNNNESSKDRVIDHGRAIAGEINLMDTKGNHVKLSSFKGKVVVVNFFATWCPPCKGELPGFLKLAREYSNKNVVFLFVDLQETKEEVIEFVETNSFSNLAPLLDVSGEVSNRYKIVNIPTTYIIDKQGKIAYKNVGYMEESQLKKLIEKEI